ncbi:MAG: glycosyltransferase [Patescibacteria group bacterium]|nr:glycosyltransferase [Patescibacteria group bacterium]
MVLSLLVPVQQDNKFIALDFRRRYAFLNSFLLPTSFELIYVFGPKCQKAPGLLKALVSRMSHIKPKGSYHSDSKSLDDSQICIPINPPLVKIIKLKRSLGIGQYIKQGFKQADGDLITYTDPRKNIDLTVLKRMYNAFSSNCRLDAALPNRFLTESEFDVGRTRKIIYACYRTIVFFITGLILHDIHTGVAMFKRESVLKILPKLRICRRCFDIEILCHLRTQGSTNWKWVPISKDKVNVDNDSARFNILSSVLGLLREFYSLLSLRFKRFLKYK